ncbi:EAP30/Vps36 family [Novymonas esmeraldas]|uniref:EAP30/Vps36 family n=1 Tax=Novymonas esmeraldas TaxID=1808958 RepID=A0AAW0F6N6_9TRYP
MRRRVGVGHVLQERQQQQRMADLGAQITAERVGQIEDQLEELQTQLKTLAQNHKSDIKEDPVVRARFRQLADSLGVDLISSKKNVFADALGLGDFYYQLAGRTVEACMRERKFCGAYVPLQRVQFFVQKAYDASTLASGNAQNRHSVLPHSGSRGDGPSEAKRIVISEADVVTALSKLSVLGAGYNIVKLGGVSYIQTTPDGARGGDHVLLLNYVLGLQKEQLAAAKRAAAEEQQRRSTPSSSSVPSSRGTAAAPNSHRSGVGAAYALGAHPFDLDNDEGGQTSTSLSFAQQCVAVRESHIASGLRWEVHRARAALTRMVQEGTVWVEEAPRTELRSGGARNATATTAAAAKSKSILSSTEEVKEVWKGKHADRAAAVEREDVVYWFVSLTSHA